jgi:hypothetical protein
MNNILIYSFIFWIYPVVRQRKSTLSYFFVVIALSDPIALIGRSVIDAQFTYVTTIILWLSANYIFLKNKLNFRWFVLFIVLSSLITISIFLFLNTIFLQVILALVLVQILLLLLKRFAENCIKINSINGFYVILIFYTLTLLLKILILIFGVKDASSYFYSTTIFQILFGLFFSIFREDDTRLLVKLE